MRLASPTCHPFRPQPDGPSDCVRVTDDRLLKPDPSIYDQILELSSGRQPTWDSPDILTHNLGPFSPLDNIEATIRNLSPDASSYNTQVSFSWSDFGIGQARRPLGALAVDLDRAGFATAQKKIKIATPPEVRPNTRYCLFVDIAHPYDRNRSNNHGEQAIDVRHTRDVGNNPQFVFPLTNNLPRPALVDLHAVNPLNWFFAAVVATLGPSSPLQLNPGESRQVTVSIAVPAGTPVGVTGTFSLYATTAEGLLGGVGLMVIVD